MVIETGVHPCIALSENAGAGTDVTQIVLVIESRPQSEFPVLSLIVYVPIVVKRIPKLVDALFQIEGSDEPKSLPAVPLVIVHPLAGEICQTDFPLMHPPDVAPLNTTLVLVKVTVVLTHTVSLGEIEKVATGFCET